MFLTMFFKTQNIAQTMHLTMLIAHHYREKLADVTALNFPFKVDFVHAQEMYLLHVLCVNLNHGA